MAAFNKTESGIPMMDEALQYIRLGDNVVWQVPSLDEFRVVAERFADQAIRDKRNLIYFRFAEHEPILTPREGLRIINVELSHRFETFTVDIHNLIEKEGRDAFYVFDCLSEVEAAWATDLMMGDFFHLTCPYLFILDTVAYFPLIRGRHSFDAIATIRDTTQLFLDIYSEEGQMYVRPMKVWKRYSPTMFQPHHLDVEKGEFRVLSDGTEVSHFYSIMNKALFGGVDQNLDSWERFFKTTKRRFLSGEDVTEACSHMCNIMLTRDERMRKLIKENFRPEDYFEIHGRMIGTGMIGGKACGMLLARKIIENHNPDLFTRLEPHDSFYIGSDVFYSFIVDNGFWDLRIRQRTEEGYFDLAEEFAERLMSGTFSSRIETELRRIIDYYGNIVEFIYDHYRTTGTFPSETEIKDQIGRIKDLIAYRIVVSLPKCHLKADENRQARELGYLYEIANALPDFLEERGFNPELSGIEPCSMTIDGPYRKYYRDYIENPNNYGYKSLHISFFDNTSRSNIEVQLRTKEMDDNAEIGPANHLGYEKRQEKERSRREEIPVGKCVFFDDAYERGMRLQELDLSKVDVNMFGATNNNLINDGCGLYRGRLILPYEHLSRFQNDLI